MKDIQSKIASCRNVHRHDQPTEKAILSSHAHSSVWCVMTSFTDNPAAEATMIKPIRSPDSPRDGCLRRDLGFSKSVIAHSFFCLSAAPIRVLYGTAPNIKVPIYAILYWCTVINVRDRGLPSLNSETRSQLAFHSNGLARWAQLS